MYIIGAIGIAPKIETSNTSDPNYVTFQYLQYYTGMVFTSVQVDKIANTNKNGHFLVNCFNHTFNIEVGDQTISYVDNNGKIRIGKTVDKKRTGGKSVDVKIQGLTVTQAFGNWFFDRTSGSYFYEDNTMIPNPTCNDPVVIS